MDCINLLFVFFIFLVLKHFLHWRFISNLKTEHSELWVQVGEPTFLSYAADWIAWDVNKYLLYKKYEGLSNVESKDYAAAARLPILLSSFCAVASLLAFMVCLLLNGASIEFGIST
jgi:hypothetical protein